MKRAKYHCDKLFFRFPGKSEAGSEAETGLSQRGKEEMGLFLWTPYQQIGYGEKAEAKQE